MDQLAVHILLRDEHFVQKNKTKILVSGRSYIAYKSVGYCLTTWVLKAHPISQNKPKVPF